MENLELYEGFRSVPQEAKKAIGAGRLKGMTDINPMWRIKALTERFGPCGIGWKYTITSQWLEPGADGVVSAFCNITLQYKWEGEWSEPVPGTGGSAYVAKERSGLYTSDECYKQALTDAISVAAKALGIGADVYWDKDRTKYSPKPGEGCQPAKTEGQTPPRQEIDPLQHGELAPGEAECPVCHKIQRPMKKMVDGEPKLLSGYEIIVGCGGMCLSCYRGGNHDAV